jgi:hypothetical protein
MAWPPSKPRWPFKGLTGLSSPSAPAVCRAHHCIHARRAAVCRACNNVRPTVGRLNRPHVRTRRGGAPPPPDSSPLRGRTASTPTQRHAHAGRSHPQPQAPAAHQLAWHKRRGAGSTAAAALLPRCRCVGAHQPRTTTHHGVCSGRQPASAQRPLGSRALGVRGAALPALCLRALPGRLWAISGSARSRGSMQRARSSLARAWPAQQVRVCVCVCVCAFGARSVRTRGGQRWRWC